MPRRSRSQAKTASTAVRRSSIRSRASGGGRASGKFVDVADSAPGPSADVTLLAKSADGAAARGRGRHRGSGLPGHGVLHRQGLVGATPRKKPRHGAPADGCLYNRAFSRRRIVVENSIARLRRYQCLRRRASPSAPHGACVVAVAGLVNGQIDQRSGRLRMPSKASMVRTPERVKSVGSVPLSNCED